MAEIVPVVSEALEAQVRNLLPSQRGFGEDLQASNVITPIIDLTASAQGTTTPQFLQTAWDFSTSSVFAENNTQTVTNTPGFWQIFLSIAGRGSGVDINGYLRITDGLSTKDIVRVELAGTGASTTGNTSVLEPIYVFLRAGDSATITSDNNDITVFASTRQVADVNGNLVNPLGFTPQ